MCSYTIVYHDGDYIPLKSDACKVHGAIFLVSFHVGNRFVAELYNLFNLNSVVSVSERTILIERPPLVGEVSVNFYL
jgi:hypothetical protein